MHQLSEVMKSKYLPAVVSLAKMLLQAFMLFECLVAQSV
jgi:hypothetical protein